MQKKKKLKEKQRNKKDMRYTESKMANVYSTISIIILNMNGLNNLIIRQRFSDWIFKKNTPQEPIIHFL